MPFFEWDFAGFSIVRLPMLNNALSDTYSRMLQVLNDLSCAQVSGILPAEMLQKIVAAGASLLPVAVCSLWRRAAAPRGAILNLEAMQGGCGGRTFPSRLDLSTAASRNVLESGHLQLFPNLAEMPRSAEGAMARQRRLVSMIAAPTWADGCEPDGVLLAFTDCPCHALSDLERQVTHALARQVGIVRHMEALQRQTRRMAAELETRKRVDRAKEILMDQRRMSAEDAYRWIRKRSMDSRRSMREVAETVIQSEKTGHYSSIPHALDLFGGSGRK
jgi:GAF domain-containing protein